MKGWCLVKLSGGWHCLRGFQVWTGGGLMLGVHTSFSLRSRASVASVFPNLSVAMMDPGVERPFWGWNKKRNKNALLVFIMIFYIQKNNPKNNRRTGKLLKNNLTVVVVQSLSHVQLCSLMDCSTPGLPVLHCLLQFAQIHVHWFDDAIQPSSSLSPSSSCFFIPVWFLCELLSYSSVPIP